MEKIAKEHRYLEEIVKLFFRGIIPIVFLVIGVIVLALRIPMFSLFLGIPLTIFGTVFLIYTYDEVVRKTIMPMPPRITRCSVCGKGIQHNPRLGSQGTLCSTCKKKK